MINGINHITISVNNINTAFVFYKDILKLKPVMKSNRSAYFYAGKIWIALDQREPYNPSENYAHISFNVEKCISNLFPLSSNIYNESPSVSFFCHSFILLFLLISLIYFLKYFLDTLKQI